MRKPTVEEITAKHAAERLHIDRTNVLRMIKRGQLNARLVSEAPRPYWLVSVDAWFIAIEQKRAQKKS